MSALPATGEGLPGIPELPEVRIVAWSAMHAVGWDLPIGTVALHRVSSVQSAGFLQRSGTGSEAADLIAPVLARLGAMTRIELVGLPDLPAPVARDQQPVITSGGESGLAMEALARGMSSVPAAVAVEPAQVPQLTSSSLENARRLFALTVGELAAILGVTERQMHRYLGDGTLPDRRRQHANALEAVGLTVIAGLGADGAHRWLYSGEPSGAELAREGRIDELAARANALRDSPFT